MSIVDTVRKCIESDPSVSVGVSEEDACAILQIEPKRLKEMIDSGATLTFCGHPGYIEEYFKPRFALNLNVPRH